MEQPSSGLSVKLPRDYALAHRLSKDLVTVDHYIRGAGVATRFARELAEPENLPRVIVLNGTVKMAITPNRQVRPCYLGRTTTTFQDWTLPPPSSPNLRNDTAS